MYYINNELLKLALAINMASLKLTKKSFIYIKTEQSFLCKASKDLLGMIKN